MPFATWFRVNQQYNRRDQTEPSIDDDQQEDLHDYFLEAETDKIDEAMEEFDGEFDDEELRLYRIKFISDVAN